MLLFSSDFSKISSVNFDLVGVVASGNKIAAYGTKGSVYFSNDDAQSWNVIKPFDTDNIVNFFIVKNKLIAFSQTGNISQSTDGGLTWKLINPIKDSVSYVIKGNKNFYIRAKSSIMKLNENLEILGKYDYPYHYGFNIEYHYLQDNKRLMTFFNDKLFLIDTSHSSIIIFDKYLKKINTLDISKDYFGSECYITNIINDSKSLIFKAYINKSDSTFLIRLDPVLKNFDFIYNENDTKQLGKLFKENSPYPFFYNYFNGKLYTLNHFLDSNFNGPFFNIFELYYNDSTSYIGNLDASIYNESSGSKFQLSDFVVENNRITAVAKENLIVTKKINSQSTKRISNSRGMISGSNLIQISNSDFLLQTRNNLYRSFDTTKTFKEIIEDTTIFSSYLKLDQRFNTYDEDGKKLLYFAYSILRKDSGSVFISNDYGQNFIEKKLEGVSFYNLANKYVFISTDDEYIIGEYQNKSVKYFYYDKSFNYLKTKLDDKYLYNYVYHNTSNKSYTILALPLDRNDGNRYISNTTDGGITWNNIKTYATTLDTLWFNDSTQFATTPISNLRTVKEIQFNDKDYLILVTYTPKDSTYSIEALDLANNELLTIFKEKESQYHNTLIDKSDNLFLICKGDSLFKTSDILHYNEWQGIKLSDNGTMERTILKSGNYFISYYSDDKHTKGYYRIKIDMIGKTDVSNNLIEIQPYFYNSPPYPQPASNLVTTDVYLRTGITIDKSDIKIYNITGTEIENGDNVDISNTQWPTTLTWDSSNLPSGIYFIVIDYAGYSRAIKVVKE